MFPSLQKRLKFLKTKNIHLNPILKNVLIRTACIVGCILVFIVLEGLREMNRMPTLLPTLQPLFWIRLILLTLALVWTNIYKLERPLQLLAVAGSWIAYIVIYCCLNRLEALFSPDDFFINGHPTARISLLMIASAILIWINIRKLLHPIQRIYFSIFLLILTVLIGAWKVGVFYYDQSVLLTDFYLDIFPDLGLTFVFAASLLPIFFTKWTTAKHDKKGKAWLLVSVLIFDFTIASAMKHWKREHITVSTVISLWLRKLTIVSYYQCKIHKNVLTTMMV